MEPIQLLSILGGIASIAWIVARAATKIINSILAFNRELRGLSEELKMLRIRLTDVERYLKKEHSFIPSALKEEVTKDRF